MIYPWSTLIEYPTTEICSTVQTFLSNKTKGFTCTEYFCGNGFLNKKIKDIQDIFYIHDYCINCSPRPENENFTNYVLINKIGKCKYLSYDHCNIKNMTNSSVPCLYFFSDVRTYYIEWKNTFVASTDLFNTVFYQIIIWSVECITYIGWIILFLIHFFLIMIPYLIYLVIKINKMNGNQYYSFN
jgi:hypothetical protein